MKTILVFLLLCFTAEAAVNTPLKIKVTIDRPVVSDQKAEVKGDKFLYSFTEKIGKCITYYTANDHMMKFIASVITRKVKRYYFKLDTGGFDFTDEVEENEEIINYPNMNLPHMI